MSTFDKAIAAMRKDGLSFSAIAKRLNSTKDKVQKRYARMRKGQPPPEGSTIEVLLGFSPVQLPKPSIPEAKVGRAKRILVSSDWHFGKDTYDERCEAVHLEVVRQWKPDLIVLNGDLPDLLAVSRYPKDARTQGPLQTEIDIMHKFLWRIYNEAGKVGRVVETNANHSGEGVESRWWRYLSDRVPEIMESSTLQKKLSYKSIFHPEWASIDILDHVPLAPGLIALHGDIVRSQSAYSARAMIDKWRVNLIHGHTHRFGSHFYRVPAVAGKREHQMRAFEGGCMCRLTAPYLSMSNWQQGFSLVSVDDQSGRFSVEQVLIQDGKAVVGALGCTVDGS